MPDSAALGGGLSGKSANQGNDDGVAKHFGWLEVGIEVVVEICCERQVSAVWFE